MGFLLSRLGYDASHEMGAALAEFGLELRQFGLLRLLAEAQGPARGESPCDGSDRGETGGGAADSGGSGAAESDGAESDAAESDSTESDGAESEPEPHRRSRAASQRALGALLNLTPNRMVALVDGLEARGLIERRPHPQDRRAHAIALTEAGAETFRRAMRAAFTVEASMCAPLDAAEREQLLSLLRTLAAARDRRPGASAGVHPGMFEPDEQSPRGA